MTAGSDGGRPMLDTRLDRLFVGRERERAAFRELLDPESKQNVLYIHSGGEGGIGKTWLLQKIIGENKANPDILMTDPLIDFYHTENRRTSGVRRSIIDRLGEAPFEEFRKAEEEFNQARRRGLSAEAVDGLRVRMDEQFILDCCELAKNKRCVLVFDTFERVQREKVGDWLLNTLANRVEGFVFAISGRNPLETPSNNIRLICLSGLEEEEAVRYFIRRGVPESEAQVDEVRTIWQKAEGRPILIDLAIELWQNGAVANLADVAELPIGEFESALVSKIWDLQDPIDYVILYMAHLRRRFTREILAQLVDASLIAADKRGINTIFRRLLRFSFVKYREFPESYLLHDEMQRMVEKHIWMHIDPKRELRRQADEAVERFYTKYVEERLAEARDETERQNLQAEQLTYILDHDVDRGWEVFLTRFDEALREHQFGFGELLLGEINEYEAKYPLHKRAEIALRRARWWRAVGEFSRAENVLLTMLDEYVTEDELRVEMLIEFGNIVIRLGDIPKGIEYFQQANGIAVRHEGELEWTRWLVSTELALAWTAWLASTELALGWGSRRLGGWDIALEHHSKALEYSALAGDEILMATALNDTGYIHQLLGEHDVAKGKCFLGLQIRQRVFGERSREAGYSYSTLGEIYRYNDDFRSALEYYEKALEIFREHEDFEWVGIVLQERGIANWAVAVKYKDLGEHEKAEENLQKAYKDLETSIELCERYNLAKDRPTAYHRFGHVWAAKEDFEQALRWFKKSHEVAMKVGDFHYALDSLVEMAELEFQRGRYGKVREYADELEQLDVPVYQQGLFRTIVRTLLADIAYQEGRLGEALEAYCELYPQIARDRGYGLRRILPKKFDLLKAKLYKLPLETCIDWCDRLIECWRGGELEATQPAIIVAMEDIRRDAVVRLSKERRQEAQDV
jgi:tetratricopeptide (TPR) repeat protein